MPDAAPSAGARYGTGVLAVDLDGTVVGINTFPSFVRFLARHLADARRPVPLARLLAVVVLRKVHLARHSDLKRVVCTLAGTVPDREVRAWAQTLLAAHGHPAVLDVLAGWSGPKLLTTAAPEVYGVHLGELLGIPVVHGSTVHDGVLVNNEGEQKCVRLRADGLDRVALFLTDDVVVDAPMAALADRVLAVDRRGRLRELSPVISSAASHSPSTATGATRSLRPGRWARTVRGGTR